MKGDLLKMKYEAPKFEKREIEAQDVITTSFTVEETSGSSANYVVDISKIFGKQ